MKKKLFNAIEFVTVTSFLVCIETSVSMWHHAATFSPLAPIVSLGIACVGLFAVTFWHPYGRKE